jgi:enterochelin esterase-like enzyme
MRANFRDDTAMKPAIRVHEVGSGSRTRLLVVLDGPEYQRQMRLLALLRRFVERGEVKPHRVALVVPEDRLESYSASARFARSLAETLAELKAKPVGVGSSLGGLALLHAHRLEPSSFAGLFLQSGSYFRRRTDPQERTFRRFSRIDRFVGTVLNATDRARPVPTTLTCALDEENYANNAAIAQALAAQGYAVSFHAARGGHDWPTWRRALDSHLAPLLRKVWR